MKEKWKFIPGYEKSYMVSDKGRVKSLDRVVILKATKTAKEYSQVRKGKLLKPGRNTKQGHVTVSLGRRNSINVHRLVMLAFEGPCPEGHEVLHNNGKAWDNRFVNLRYGTRAENNIDASRHGTRKLTADNVRLIRKNNKPNRFYAEKFGVSISTVSAAKTYQNWKWL